MQTDELYGDIASLLSAVDQSGHELRIGERIPRIHLPFGAEAGYVVHIDQDRFFAYQFGSQVEALDHAWVNPHSLQVHHLVLENYPPDQWVNHQQFRRKPDRDIGWSALVEDEEFKQGLLQAVEPGPQGGVASFRALLESLSEAGYPVHRVEWLHGGQLYPGAQAGVFCRIRRHRFLVYRYPDGASADAFVDQLPAGISCGPWVLRSDPATQYLAKETITLPPERVDWSRLLEEEEFVKAVKKAVEGASPAEETQQEVA